VSVNILKYKDDYRTAMIALWERSVRATHDFLTSDDIDDLVPLVQGIDFYSFDVYCAFNENDEMVGILGVADQKLEMLFLEPKEMGKGIGRQLMDFVMTNLAVNKVDVNEGNTNAINFYKKFGFKVYDRSPLDDYGKPYPILKMKL
jgi:putative acetyltransferase